MRCKPDRRSRKMQFSLGTLFAIITAFSFGIASGLWAMKAEVAVNRNILKNPIDPFPPIDQIVGITVDTTGSPTSVPAFSVPNNSWRLLLATLLPAEVQQTKQDRELEGVGKIIITLVDGSEFCVDVYRSDGDNAKFVTESNYHRYYLAPSCSQFFSTAKMLSDLEHNESAEP